MAFDRHQICQCYLYELLCLRGFRHTTSIDHTAGQRIFMTSRASPLGIKPEYPEKNRLTLSDILTYVLVEHIGAQQQSFPKISSDRCRRANTKRYPPKRFCFPKELGPHKGLFDCTGQRLDVQASISWVCHALYHSRLTKENRY